MTLISESCTDTNPPDQAVVGTGTPHQAGALTTTWVKIFPTKTFLSSLEKGIIPWNVQTSMQGYKKQKNKGNRTSQRNTVTDQLPQKNGDLGTVKDFKIIVLKEHNELQEKTGNSMK